MAKRKKKNISTKTIVVAGIVTFVVAAGIQLLPRTSYDLCDNNTINSKVRQGLRVSVTYLCPSYKYTNYGIPATYKKVTRVGKQSGELYDGPVVYGKPSTIIYKDGLKLDVMLSLCIFLVPTVSLGLLKYYYAHSRN